MVRAGLALLAALAASWAAPTAAQDTLLRSDLPLWTEQTEEMYPQHFADDEAIGCISNIRTGDFRLTEEVEGGQPYESWFRVHNSGAFHCALVIRDADRREDLETAAYDFFWTIVLDQIQTANGERELIAFQQGSRGGSTYQLFSRRADGSDRNLTLLRPNAPSPWSAGPALSTSGGQTIARCRIAKPFDKSPGRPPRGRPSASLSGSESYPRQMTKTEIGETNRGWTSRPGANEGSATF